MSTETANAIQEKLRALPIEQQERVLAFVEELTRKTGVRRNRTLDEIIDEHIKDVPQDALDELPVDASENLDHYLYGAPKK